MLKTCFASDLHLFSRRSSADRHLDDLIRIARESEICVLGGDIFDFRWSVLESDAVTAEAAIEWLHDFNKQIGDCSLHFLLGNHDDHPLLHELLPELQKETEGFEWSRFYHRLGNTLFLHGDVADKKSAGRDIEQQRNSFRHGSRSPLQHQIYDLAVRAQLHRIAPPAVYPRKKVARRILSYLEQIGHGPQTGIQHVCFGHTHRPIDNYHLGNVTFHNGGAPIGSSKFRIVKRDVLLTSSTMPSAETPLETVAEAERIFGR